MFSGITERTRWQQEARCQAPRAGQESPLGARQDLEASRDAYVAGSNQVVVNFPPSDPLYYARPQERPTDPIHRVFVVYGRNESARSAMFAFLRAIGLYPIEWSRAVEMTGEGSPYIGQVLDTAFKSAQAIVVLLTPDDTAYLRAEYASGSDDPESEPKGQARPNVLFEAGMAMGRDTKRTVLVEMGDLRPFTDIGGRYAVQINNSAERRNELARRLKSAGCPVDLNGSDWLNAGDFSPPLLKGNKSSSHVTPGAAMPLKRIRFKSKYGTRAISISFSRDYQLTITNQDRDPVYDVDIELPDNIGKFKISDVNLPAHILLPGGNLYVECTGPHGLETNCLRFHIVGRSAEGELIREEATVDI